MDEMNTIVLTDEEGNDQEFEIVDTYEDEESGNLYYGLVPFYENPEDMPEEEAGLVVLRAEETEDGEEELVSIEDDAEYEKIGNIILNRISEAYDE